MMYRKVIIVLSVVLFLSVSANVFMGAMLAGRFMPDQNTAAQKMNPWDEIKRKMPAEDRDILHNEMRVAKKEMRRIKQELDDVRDKIRAIVAEGAAESAELTQAVQQELSLHQQLIDTMDQAKETARSKMSATGQAVMDELEALKARLKKDSYKRHEKNMKKER